MCGKPRSTKECLDGRVDLEPAKRLVCCQGERRLLTTPIFNRRQWVNFPHVGSTMSCAAMTARISPTNVIGIKKELTSDLYRDRCGVGSAGEEAWVQRIKRFANLGN